jgi:hypothetical protein
VAEVADEARRIVGSSVDRVGGDGRADLLPLGEGGNEDLINFARLRNFDMDLELKTATESYKFYSLLVFFWRGCGQINMLGTRRKMLKWKY